MCVLRAFGDSFDPQTFVRTSSLTPYSVYRGGEKHFKVGAAVHENSGLKVEVSQAAWDDWDGQFNDALVFIRENAKELKRLIHWPGVECVVLDFPLEAGELATFVRCPVELARASSALNIALEFSVYPRTPVA
jgi:hypothetical protein